MRKKSAAALPALNDKIILTIIISVLILTNLLFLLTKGYPGDDFQYSFQLYSLDVFNSLRVLHPFSVFTLDSYYPPFLPLFTSLFYLIIGTSEFSAYLSLSLFWVILILSVYGIGRNLYGREVGLLAAILTGLFPFLTSMSLQYTLDFPLTAMVSLSLYLLLKTENFNSRKYSLLFGIFVGIGLLTKWSFFIFVIGPAIYVIISSIRTKKFPLLNIGISLIISLILASLWYLPNFRIFTGPFGLYAIQTWNSLPWYEYLFYLQNQLSVPLCAIALFSLIYYSLKSRKRFLLPWIVIPYIFLSLLPGKSIRYSIPYLPAFSLIIAWAILSLTKRKPLLRNISCLLIIGLMAAMQLNLLFGMPLPSPLRFENLCYVKLTAADYNLCVGLENYAPNSGKDWQIETVLKDIVTDTTSMPYTHNTMLGIATCSPNLGYSNFLFRSRIEHLNLALTSLVAYPDLPGHSIPSDIEEQYLSQDYLIFQSSACLGRYTIYLLTPDWAGSHGFKQIKNYTLPEGINLYLLKKSVNETNSS